MTDILGNDAVGSSLSRLASTPPCFRKRVVEAAALITGVSPEAIVKKCSNKKMSQIRFGIIYVSMKNVPGSSTGTSPKFSYSSLGRILHRDHSTIMHGFRRAQALMETDPAFRAYVDALELQG